MAAMDKLVQLMQIQKMMDDNKFRNQKYATDLAQQKMTNKFREKQLSIDELIQQRAAATAKRAEDKQNAETNFRDITSTNNQYLMQEYAKDRPGFYSEMSQQVADYPLGAPKGYVSDQMKMYDQLFGKKNAGQGRPVLVQNVEDPDNEGHTKSVALYPDGSQVEFPTVATASTMLRNNPEVQGSIEEAVTNAKNEANTLRDMRKVAWDSYNTAQTSLEDYNQIEAALEGWRPGVGSEMRMIPDKMKSFFGVEDTEGLTNKKIFDTMEAKGMLRARGTKGGEGGLPGATSDKDLDFLKKAVMNADMPQDAIKIMLNFKREEAARQKAIFEIVNSHTGSSSELKGKINQYMEDNPYDIRSAKTINTKEDLDNASVEDLVNQL